MTANPRPAPGSATDPDGGAIEAQLGNVLQLGTYLSIGLIAIGTLLLLAAGGSPLDGGPAFAADRIVSDIVSLRPAGFLWLGIVGVLSTPAVRVIRATIGFARAGERRLVAVGIIVLAVIAFGVAVGIVSG